eukprot:Phypoly_transcript_11379.p1 GENE.Phypoly_transcript_11379~~Phypoly_transcript_11379.p1  ORF type:complete len:123 (+),score=12.89 Phypoly_transcript_11379:722-1090(+)
MVGIVGVLTVCRFAFAMHTHGIHARVFADALISFAILVLMLLVFIRSFGQRYLLTIFVPSHTQAVPPFYPSPPISLPSSLSASPEYPRKAVNICGANTNIDIGPDGIVVLTHTPAAIIVPHL